MIWYCDCQDPARSALVHSGVSALHSTPVDSVPDRLLRRIVSRHNVSLVDSRSLFDWPVSSDQSLSPLRPMSRPLSHVRVWLGPGEPHNVIYLESEQWVINASVFLWSLVRHGKIWHQVHLSDIRVQDRQPRLQVYWAGRKNDYYRTSEVDWNI